VPNRFFVMSSAGALIQRPTGYAGIVTKAPRWQTFVVCDILFNRLATGLFLVAAVGELVAPAIFTSVATLAYAVALRSHVARTGDAGGADAPARHLGCTPEHSVARRPTASRENRSRR